MKALLPIFVVTLFVGMSIPAQALFMELDRPGLSFPENFRGESQKEIQQALEHPDSKFLGGTVLNWNTTLRYSGSTTDLNLFLESLSNCDGAIVRISFVESLPDTGDWHVNHSAHERGGFGFHVRINLESNKISLVDLKLPEIRAAEPQR